MGNWYLRKRERMYSFLRIFLFCQLIPTTPSTLTILRSLEHLGGFRWRRGCQKRRVGVIVYSKGVGVILDISYVKGRWIWDAGIIKNVTHWQPLPKGPEDK